MGLIVWAFGGCRKIQKRNFARASLIITVIMLVIGMIFGMIVRSFFKKIEAEVHEVTGEVSDTLGLENIAGVFTDIEKNANGTSDPSVLLDDISDNTGDANADIPANADATENMMDAIADNNDSLDELMQNVEAINEEAAKNADGWPSSLPDYPDGTMTTVETYRTEIFGTSKDTMLSYIDTLKQNGFEFQDFLEFGFSEQDMLDMNGWWRTDGNLYLSFSYYDGTVTIDHMNEIPDMSSLLGG